MPINNSKNYQSMHEIVKYPPLFYDANGVFHKNEWTSCSEIGKSFDGKKLTTEEYFTTENNYILAMCEIIRVTGSAHMTVEYLEKDELWIEQRMKTSKIREQDLLLLPTALKVKQGDRLSISEFSEVARLCLREYLYGEFVDINYRLRIIFGYDYYMSIESDLDNGMLKSIANKHSLYLDPR